jgi:SAM-dependent methyltransferase
LATILNRGVIMGSSYLFDNAAEREAEQRFGSLAALYDVRTTRFLAATGLAPGWRCLEIGAGGGSIAAWLADQVGATGHVTATDIDPRFLTALEALGRTNVGVQRHDIAADPLPPNCFDLIHTRLVFVHLPRAREVLGRVAAALAPGGWLVVEDFGPSPESEFIVAATDPADVALVRRALAAHDRLLASRGVAVGWARGLYQSFRALGLRGVGLDGQIMVGAGGSAYAHLLRANFAQLREPAIAAGLLTTGEFDRLLALLEDPDFALSTPVLFSAWGRRPQEVAPESAH